MKTNRIKCTGRMFRVSLYLLSTILFVQCIGPRGPQGEDGLDGINYTRSVIYDVNPSSWEGDVNGYYAYLDVPEINNDIYYNGAVLVYRIIETEPMSFNMLPYTYVDNGLAIYMDFDAYIGGIDLTYKEVYNGVNDTPALTGMMSFKVVIIEGIPIATLKSMVDISDYAAVSKLLNNNSEQRIIK